MPILKLVGRNVCGHRSPFLLRAFLKKDTSIVAPDGHVLIELDAELEPVVEIASDGVSAGETFTYETEIDQRFDLRDAQWASAAELQGRFELISLQWGEHSLIKQPGIV